VHGKRGGVITQLSNLGVFGWLDAFFFQPEQDFKQHEQ